MRSVCGRLDLDGYYVAVLDYIVPTLDPQQPLVAGGRVAAALDQLAPADRLGFDEGVLDLAVDRARRLPGGGATAQRPRHRFLVLAGGEEDDQLEQLVGGADEAGEAGALDPVGLAHLLRFGLVELGQLALDPGADGDHAGADLGRVLAHRGGRLG